MRWFRSSPPWRRVRLLGRVRLWLAAGLLGLAALAAVGRAPTVSGPVATGAPHPAASHPHADPGTVAVPIRLADPALGTIVRPGDRVDVIAVGDDGVGDVVAGDVVVLAVPTVPAGSAADGTLLVVAATERSAPRLVSAAIRARLAISLRPP
ncbi:MAG TPA: hypothetical protein VLJ59_02725 [Mycobacteriales bacterium]|nr:hypothetical protein [Mycobacteriales bacterium]